MILFKRFPKSFPKSELILSIKAFCEKSPSCPKGTSLKRKYLNASNPYASATSLGFTTFPYDLLIFSPSLVHQP